jgi:hypothetical protein
VTRLQRERIFLAVHRVDFTVYYRRIASEEYGLLNALRVGQPFGRAIRTGFKGSPVASGEQPSMLEQWFSAWAELGWLCSPARAGKKKRRISQ